MHPIFARRPVASSDVNSAKTRLQALGLLDRAFKAASDEELNAAIDALGDDHRAAVDELVNGEADATKVRAAVSQGRLDGTMESLAMVVTDAALADCIEQLGDHADHPSSEQLREVLPGIVERHSKGIVQIMLGSTVVGEAPAAAIIRDILKSDEQLKLPPAEPAASAPLIRAPQVDPEERAAIKAKRKELKQRKQEEARRRREQAAQAKSR